MDRSVFPAGFRGTWHAHPAAQLIYPSRGVMILETAAGCWVVPPQQACWLPSNENHRVQTSAGFEMLSVYCRGSVLRRLPEAPGVVAVSGLLRECIFASKRQRRAPGASVWRSCSPRKCPSKSRHPYSSLNCGPRVSEKSRPLSRGSRGMTNHCRSGRANWARAAGPWLAHSSVKRI